MLDRVEIFVGMMILINAVHLMVWRVIVHLWLSVRDRNNRVVRGQDRLGLNGRPVVGCRVMEGFRGRLVHRLHLGNIRSLIDRLRSMVDRLRSLIDGFWSLIDGFRSLIDRLMSLMDGLMIARSGDVVMLDPTVNTVHSVTILVERLWDIRWS